MIGGFDGLARGLTRHKNDLGQQIVLSVTVALYATNIPKYVRYYSIFAGMLLIVESYSGQSLTLIAIVFIVYVMSRSTKNSSVQARLGIYMLYGVAIIIFSYAIFASGVYFEILGKSEDLSSRDIIWEFFAQDIISNNFWGYGLDAFDNNQSLYTQLATYGIWWPLATSHSSYLEAFVRLGWIGGCIFLWIAVQSVSAVFLKIFSADDLTAGFAVILTCALIGGITASEKLFLPDFGWMSFMLGYIGVTSGRGNRRPIMDSK